MLMGAAIPEEPDGWWVGFVGGIVDVVDVEEDGINCPEDVEDIPTP